MSCLWNEEYIKLLSNFKNVRFGLSIDSHIENEFNYIRHKSNYNVVIENCDKFINYINKHQNMTVYISVTSSVLNIWNLPEIVDGLKNRFNIDVGYTNFVYDPKHFDIRHLPREVKRKIIQKYDKKLQLIWNNILNKPGGQEKLLKYNAWDSVFEYRLGMLQFKTILPF